jgi:hypothetical protein
MPISDAHIAALKRERAGYLARGLEERAKMVDDELRKHGAAEEKPAEKPTGRTTREERQATADDKPAKSTAAKAEK